MDATGTLESVALKMKRWGVSSNQFVMIFALLQHCMSSFSWHFLILSLKNTEYTAPKEHGNKSIGRQVRWSRGVLRQVGRCHGGLRFGVHLTRCIAGHQPAWRFDWGGLGDSGWENAAELMLGRAEDCFELVWMWDVCFYIETRLEMIILWQKKPVSKELEVSSEEDCVSSHSDALDLMETSQSQRNLLETEASQQGADVRKLRPWLVGRAVTPCDASD